MLKRHLDSKSIFLKSEKLLEDTKLAAIVACSVHKLSHQNRIILWGFILHTSEIKVWTIYFSLEIVVPKNPRSREVERDCKKYVFCYLQK